VLAGVLVLASLSAAVEVTARPEDTRCPARLSLAAALDGRVPAQATRWSVRYRVEAPAAGATERRVWLELRDGLGDLRLRRELAIAPDQCDAAADAIALIVARYFREVSWTGAVPLPDMERKAEPPPPPPRSGPPWELELGLSLRRETRLVPGLAWAARVPVGERWRLVGGFVLQLPQSQSVEQESVGLWGLPVRASLRRFVASGALAFDGGPQVTAAYERASRSGPTDTWASRLLVAAGAVCSGRWAVAPAWALAIDFSVEVGLFAPEFRASTAQGTVPVWTPHRIQLAATANLARAF
jgi:hypothetical protein